MPKKYKLTGCARFLIFLLIVAPIVYLGVSFAQGENPLGLIKNTWDNVTEKVQSTTSSSSTDNTSQKEETTKIPSSDIGEASILEQTINVQKKRIDDQNDYIESLESQITNLKKQLERERAKDVPVNKNIGN